MNNSRGDEASGALAIISTRAHTRSGKRVMGLSGEQLDDEGRFTWEQRGLGEKRRVKFD